MCNLSKAVRSLGCACSKRVLTKRTTLSVFPEEANLRTRFNGFVYNINKTIK